MEKSDPGPTYQVHSNCIACSACWELAPSHFASHELDAVAYVIKQPVTVSEIELCEEARKICPVEAILRSEANSSSR